MLEYITLYNVMLRLYTENINLCRMIDWLQKRTQYIQSSVGICWNKWDIDSWLCIRRIASDNIMLTSTVLILGHCIFWMSWGTVLVTTTCCVRTCISVKDIIIHPNCKITLIWIFFPKVDRINLLWIPLCFKWENNKLLLTSLKQCQTCLLKL